MKNQVRAAAGPGARGAGAETAGAQGRAERRQATAREGGRAIPDVHPRGGRGTEKRAGVGIGGPGAGRRRHRAGVESLHAGPAGRAKNCRPAIMLVLFKLFYYGHLHWYL